jgi:dienelactone hydrolase
MKHIIFGWNVVMLLLCGVVAADSSVVYPTHGMRDGLPAFHEQAVARMDFPLAYRAEGDLSFDAWRVQARAKFLECLLTPPPATPFAPQILAVEKRDGYEARKLAFNVSADCRIPAYLLVPEGKGPFPAIIALHDHGAHFSIGKEKVVRPFGVSKAIEKDAKDWAEQCYGGRFFGDELAKRGYVVFAADALFWGERGRKEGVKYEAQQELSANLLQLGMTWVGVITWDDMRSVEFLAEQAEVDPKRIGAMGLSMGSHRTWMLSAATDRVAAGAAICWMGTTPALMAPGNNQTKGQSAYSMLVPNLRNFLDYPDVASIACPKPMLFFNGTQDGLFPVKAVEAAYAKMGAVWQSQEVSDQLKTKLWPVPHVFNQAMQKEAFAWMDAQLKSPVASR